MPKTYSDFSLITKQATWPAVIGMGGNERELVDKALGLIKKQVLQNSLEDFNFEQISAKFKNIFEILLLAKMLPIMSERRLIFVRESESIKLENPKYFESYLKNPNQLCILVFIFDQIDSRQKFQKVIDQSGALYKFEHPKDREMSAEILKRSKNHGLKLSYDAAQYLHFEIGTNLLLLERALEKLELLGETEISAEQIDSHISQTAFGDAFSLARFIIMGDKKNTVQALGQLRSAREVPLKLVGVLAWQFRVVLKVRIMLDAKTSSRDIASKIRLFGDRLDLVLRAAKKLNLKEQSQRIRDLLKLDLSLKSSRAPAWLNFEQAVLKMIG